MQIANPLVDVVRAANAERCKQCSRGGKMIACHDRTVVRVVDGTWLFRETTVRVDYTCGCHETIVEPRKWNEAHPEYETQRPK